MSKTIIGNHVLNFKFGRANHVKEHVRGHVELKILPTNLTRPRKVRHVRIERGRLFRWRI